jgi:carbon starvation protein
MNAALACVVALGVYALGYRFYGGYLATRVFGLRAEVKTPAHVYEDGVDYVPTGRGVLFGHHYASIAGLAPMLGPAVAVIWGWVPAMVWVVLGALFVGCVQDMGALVVSVRAQGKSIGVVAGSLIGRRAKTLFHVVIFFLVSLAMGVFVYVIAFLFSPATRAEEASAHFPQAVLPSFGLMGIAAVMGWLGTVRGVSWRWMTPVGLVSTAGLAFLAMEPGVMAALGVGDVERAPGIGGWSVILLGYAFAASVLPVWSLLQPRDHLNCLMLYVGLGCVYLGIMVGQPVFVAPAFDPAPEGAPPMWPFVFMIVACGAASGFHSLVSSGTTAKQLDRETDAQVIGYGGMIGESLLGLVAVLATTAGMASEQVWHEHYASWASVQGLGAQVGLFIQGCATFLEALGIERGVGASLVSLIVVSYALTSLDSATRLLRYNVEEIAQTFGVGWLENRWLSSLVACGAIGFFAFYRVDGKAAGLALWGLFGTTNQLMAGLALLAVTLYLFKRGRAWWVTGLPMVWMMGTTVAAMVVNIREFAGKGQWLLCSVGLILLVLAAWLIMEAGLAVRAHRRAGHRIEGLEVELTEP